MNDIVKTEQNLPVVTPMHMIQVALDKGSTLEQMQQLMDLQERWEKNEARKAFMAAMSQFKANPPEIKKDKHVSYKTNSGQINYDHASLGNVADAISECMGKHGLSFRWKIDQDKDIKVTCIVTHALGYFEETPLSAGHDSSGGKNGIQAIGSTITYLQRYTLLSATGLASQDQDDDGRGSEPPTPITEEQRLHLVATLDENNISEARWLKLNKLESLQDIQQAQYQDALQSILKAKKAEK